MDGTNSAGRKVSLLNDHEPPKYLPRLNSFAPSLRSRTSSYDSSCIGSPPTPQLVRSHSSDSNSMQTPSPITPEFAFDAQDPSDFSQTSFFPQQKEIYPSMHSISGSLPYHPAHAAHAAHAAYFAQHPAHDNAATSPAAQPQANGRPRKNQYPCPMAKAIGCKDYFTTSGHAARHAKKHTGKKDAICPECNKAFTRKDNMEQHRRTHQSGRAASKVSDRDAKKIKLRTQQQRPKLRRSEDQGATPLMAQVSLVDPSLPLSPVTPYMAPLPSAEPFVDQGSREYPDPSRAYNAPPYGGLNALANAATSQQQLFLVEHGDDQQ
jgi:hypothetical protein